MPVINNCCISLTSELTLIELVKAILNLQTSLLAEPKQSSKGVCFLRVPRIV